MSEPSASQLKIHGRLLARNTVFNLLGQALPLLVAFVCLPYLIGELGTDRFGVLALAWVVLGYFVFFDLGLGRASTKFIAEALGSAGHAVIPGLLWTASATQAALGSLGGLLLAGLTPLLVERVLAIPAALNAEARISFYLLALSLPIVLISTSLRGALEAAQRFDLVNALRAPLSAANFLLPTVGALLGLRLPGVVALLVASRFVSLILHYWLCLRVFPSVRGWPRPQWPAFRTLIGFGGWVTLSSAVGPALLYLDRFTLGIVSTVAAVGYYSAPYEMVARLWILPSSLVATLFPAWSTLAAEGQRERLGNLAVRSLKYMLILLTPPTLILVACADPLLRLWLGDDFANQSTRALQILAFGILVSTGPYVAFSLLQSVGRPDLPARVHLIELPLHAVLVWWLVSSFHITGAALAWSLRFAADTILLFALCGRWSLLSSQTFLIQRIPQTVLLILVSGTMAVLLGPLAATPWLRAGLAGVVAAAAAVTSWRLLLNESDRDQILSLIRPAIAK